MTFIALATKVVAAATESQPKRSFRDLLKSSEAVLFLSNWEIFCGSGLPPGPVWTDEGVRLLVLLAVHTLRKVKTKRKKKSSIRGEA